jgi:hypothetical protein
LPLPPSFNRLLARQPTAVASIDLHEYEAWQHGCWPGFEVQRPACIPGAVAIAIAVGRPDRRPRDIENLGKSLLEFLT